MTVKITALVDNEASEGLRSEHGLSLWVEAKGRCILFDTGQGQTLAHNARRLGVPLAKADAIVLSHGHYDHTGGMAELLSVAPTARVILHPGAVIARYSVGPGKPPRAIGIPQAARDAVARVSDGRVIGVLQPFRLAAAMGVTGPIPRETSYEDVGGPFFLDPRGERRDAIEDDQALWIGTPDGLIVCVGCSHAGVINTLQYVRKVSGISSIRAVIGGFHLRHANDWRIEKTMDALRSLSPGMLAPCHCTGEVALRALENGLGASVSRCRAGMRFSFQPGAAGTRNGLAT